MLERGTPPASAEVLICGAGIAGVATAHELAVVHGVRDVVLVDEGAPLALTSDKSTEAYRNWWPDEAMVRLMNRSIDRLEALADESDDAFLLNRRGYLYATADAARVPAMIAAAERAAANGAGPVRGHTARGSESPYAPSPARGWRGAPDGADLLLDAATVRRHFPFVTPEVVAAVHVRRAGWFSGQQLGMLLLERAREAGVRFVTGRVTGATADEGRVRAVRVERGGRATDVAVTHFVNAAGPRANEVARFVGLELPIFSERHFKASFRDHRRVVPRSAPLLIWQDPQRLPWTAEERALLADSPETAWWLDELPGGVHARPEGGDESENVLLLWAIDVDPVDPTFPLPDAPELPEVAMRGMATMIPGLAAYLDALPPAFVDGGYYTKTRENRLLAGPLPVRGAFVVAALSGYGLMAAAGAAELVALHLVGGPLPPYASDFCLSRYDDPSYAARIAHFGSSGQL